MKKPTTKLIPSPEIDDLKPYWPGRGRELLHLVVTSLAELHGRKLEYQEIACLAGRPTTTIFSWLEGAKLMQVELFLRLFEQLPCDLRERIMSKLCRCLPTLEDERLAWSESQVGRLRQLLRQKNGISILQGDENACGWVLNALGHSSWRGPNSRPVRGLDIRTPERFVAVPGVLYLNQPASTERMQILVRKGWNALRRIKDHLILLNGVTTVVPELEPEIWLLAKHCHVVVAGRLEGAGSEVKRKAGGTVEILSVREEPNRRIRIGF